MDSFPLNPLSNSIRLRVHIFPVLDDSNHGFTNPLLQEYSTCSYSSGGQSIVLPMPHTPPISNSTSPRNSFYNILFKCSHKFLMAVQLQWSLTQVKEALVTKITKLYPCFSSPEILALRDMAQCDLDMEDSVLDVFRDCDSLFVFCKQGVKPADSIHEGYTGQRKRTDKFGFSSQEEELTHVARSQTEKKALSKYNTDSPFLKKSKNEEAKNLLSHTNSTLLDHANEIGLPGLQVSLPGATFPTLMAAPTPCNSTAISGVEVSSESSSSSSEYEYEPEDKKKEAECNLNNSSACSSCSHSSCSCHSSSSDSESDSDEGEVVNVKVSNDIKISPSMEASSTDASPEVTSDGDSLSSDDENDISDMTRSLPSLKSVNIAKAPLKSAIVLRNPASPILADSPELAAPTPRGTRDRSKLLEQSKNPARTSKPRATNPLAKKPKSEYSSDLFK